jgi:hypothetical protein
MLKAVTNLVNVSQITGVLPVVNGGTGVTTSTGTGNTVLSAAPTLSGNVTLSTGNLIPSTAAKGINFTANTPAAGMTSQLLNWYEEGTWTPTIIGTTSAGTATYSQQIGRYTKIGRQVTLTLRINYTGHTGTGNMQISGIPFATGSAGTYQISPFDHDAISTIPVGASAMIQVVPSTSVLSFIYTTTGPVAATGATLPIVAATAIYAIVTYFV